MVARMASGLAASAWAVFWRIGAYPTALLCVACVAVWGMSEGWMQWVYAGHPLIDGDGFWMAVCVWFARAGMSTILLSAILWKTAERGEAPSMVCTLLILTLVLGGLATGIQSACHSASRRVAEQKAAAAAAVQWYQVRITCPHCGVSTNLNVEVGTPWTSYPSIKCGACGVTVATEKFPEYGPAADAACQEKAE